MPLCDNEGMQESENKIAPTPFKIIESKIFVLRSHKVMIDRDIAEFYGVSVKRLNEQVKRNRDRFPDDFMFQLTMEEGMALLVSRSQFATLKKGKNLKYAPYAFTEHGAVMLASVLNSSIAIRASIQVVRAFVRMRRVFAMNSELALKIEVLENKVGAHDSDLQNIIIMLKQLIDPPIEKEEKPFGFAPK